jgi:TnpA family transposase
MNGCSWPLIAAVLTCSKQCAPALLLAPAHLLLLARPSKKTCYKTIDSLFTEVIDWDLIETHWKDLMQVALSIQEGKISSALLLRKATTAVKIDSS